MNRPRAVVLAAVVIVLFGTVAAASDLQLIIKSEREETLWSLRTPLGSRVILQYVNSLYLAPTQEHFTVTLRGFALEEIWSTSDAVLAHNSLPTPYRRHGEFFVASVAAFVPNIVTRIGPTGQQTLRVGNQEVPLFMAGTGERVTISLRPGFLPTPFRR